LVPGTLDSPNGSAGLPVEFVEVSLLDNEDPEILLNSLSRYYRFLPEPQKEAFLADLRTEAS